MSGLIESSADARSKTIGGNFRCRTWVNFNGSGTVAIRDSGNVSSITDTATGDYSVNFTTAMADTNYCINFMTSYGNFTRESVRQIYSYSTSTVRILHGYSYVSPGSTDATTVCLTIHS